jgi:hypothetical protein
MNDIGRRIMTYRNPIRWRMNDLERSMRRRTNSMTNYRTANRMFAPRQTFATGTAIRNEWENYNRTHYGPYKREMFVRYVALKKGCTDRQVRAMMVPNPYLNRNRNAFRRGRRRR